MPVEVRELIIKATVTSDGGSVTNTASNENNDSSEEMIKACVDKVLEIIKEQHAR
jgi:hypothetical protein